jgi:ComF family protein
MVNNWIDIIQNYLLPATCLLCNGPGVGNQDLCEPCLLSLSRNNHCCYRCAEIFEPDVQTPGLCGHCLSLAPAFDETHAPFIYDDNIGHLIRTLKFNRHYPNARLLGMLLAESLCTSAELPELIIPVPLHPSQYRKRGFNQALEIAKTVAKQLAIPLDFKHCKRHRATQSQSSLSAKQRRKNLRNAFSMTKPLNYQHVAIVDDVMTTGTTVNELAKVLKKAGIKKVDVWVCARA